MNSECGFNPDKPPVSKWRAFVEGHQKLLAAAALLGFFHSAGCDKTENTDQDARVSVTDTVPVQDAEPELLDELEIRVPSDKPKTLEDYRRQFNDPNNDQSAATEGAITDEEIAKSIEEERLREKDMFRTGVLLGELGAAYSKLSVEKGPEETDLIFNQVYDTEKAVLWGIQFGASPDAANIKYKKVFEDDKYRQKLDKLMRHYAVKYQVPYEVIVAVASHESGFNNIAVSSTGAMNVMQVQLETEIRFHDPDTKLGSLESNISAAVNFLAYNKKRYGSWYVAMSGYCAGNGKVEKLLMEHGLVPKNPKQDWVKSLEENKVDIIRLLSPDYYKQHDNVIFQYALMTQIEADMARGVMEGRYKKGKVPPIMTPEEFKEAVEKYPEVGRRIIKGKKNADKFFEQLEIKPAYNRETVSK